jgi:hypothetical protein
MVLTFDYDVISIQIRFKIILRYNVTVWKHRGDMQLNYYPMDIDFF